MNKMYNSFLLVVFVSFVIREGESIKCYICHSRDNPHCFDNADVSNKLNATRCNYDTIQKDKRVILGILNRDDPIYYHCLKYTITGLAANGNKTVVRECTRAKTRNFDPCYYFKTNIEYTSSIIQTNIKLESCEVCTTDNCNGGVPAVSSSATFSIVLSSIIVMFSAWFVA